MLDKNTSFEEYLKKVFGINLGEEDEEEMYETYYGEYEDYISACETETDEEVSVEEEHGYIPGVGYVPDEED